MQLANKLVGIEALRADMGWSSFEERFYKGKLKYKIRLEEMGQERWARKIYLDRGNKSKWVLDCARIAKKCGFVRRWVQHGNSA